MNIDNINTVCVAGFGKSGYALCDLLLALKKKIKVTESKQSVNFPASILNKLKSFGVEFEFGSHSEDFAKGCQLMVLSPGVSINSEAVKTAARLKIPCVGEVEFAYWLSKAKFVAITGTNGKSTTTFLTYSLLKEKIKKVFLGGNIGIPVSSFILNTKANDIVVLEISSFQLESIVEFRPQVAAFTNIDPNHLDRHPTFKDYFEAKMNIFRNQRSDDWAVLNSKMEMLNVIEARIKSKVVQFSDEFENANQSCAFRIGDIFGVSRDVCQKVFSQFRGLPYRMQRVRQLRGITFINDSKSTNPNSTIFALKNIKGNVILIAGGKDKGVDYGVIIPHLKQVKKVNLFGAAANKIKQVLDGYAKIELFSSLKEVVESSCKEAALDDTVLFSPMCSSFDMFNNYMDRGKKFTGIVNDLR